MVNDCVYRDELVIIDVQVKDDFTVLGLSIIRNVLLVDPLQK